MRTDILYTSDLVIKDGDFAIGLSDEQHIAHIIEAMPGHYKQYPLVGVGARLYINSPLDGVFRRAVKVQLAGDGYPDISVTNSGDKINIQT